MSVWDTYPELSPADFRTLVAVTAQVLLDSEEGTRELPPDLLQLSTRAAARELAPLLAQTDETIGNADIQTLLEDEGRATHACRAVLDHVRLYPDLADKVARGYEARQQKMAGVEVLLLTGALVILAIRLKRISWGRAGGSVEFAPASTAVKTFVTGLVKAVGLTPS